MKTPHPARPLPARMPSVRACLPVLLAAAACDAPEPRWVSTSRDGVVEISQAIAGESVVGETAALYFALRNRGPQEDTLDAVVVEGADATQIHESEERDGRRVMSPIPALPIPAGEITRLVPGGTHVMLLGLVGRPAASDSLTGTLRFRSGREVSLRAVVRELTDLETLVQGGVGRSAGG